MLRPHFAPVLLIGNEYVVKFQKMEVVLNTVLCVSVLLNNFFWGGVSANFYAQNGFKNYYRNCGKIKSSKCSTCYSQNIAQNAKSDQRSFVSTILFLGFGYFPKNSHEWGQSSLTLLFYSHQPAGVFLRSQAWSISVPFTVVVISKKGTATAFPEPSTEIQQSWTLLCSLPSLIALIIGLKLKR